MSRYYNQLRSAYEPTSPEASVATRPSPAEIVPVPEAPPSDPKTDFLRECLKLCIVPKAGTPLILGKANEFSSGSDAYRALRTRLVRVMAAKKMRSVVVSSPLPGEGKTLTTMNLGLAFANLEGRRVLVVDGDLRTSGLSRLFERYDGPGLQDVLLGQSSFESVVRSTDVPDLFVVTAGAVSIGTAEAFTSHRWKEFMSWASESFDAVLVDAPPILAMADFELIAAGCEGALLVVRALQTSRDMLAKAVKQVDAKKFLGLVFNRSNPRNGGGYYGYGAYRSAAPSLQT